METELEKARDQKGKTDKFGTAFLVGISHEIRAPLNAIVGFSQILKSDEYDQKEKEIFINLINEKSEDLLDIINDIIDISLIDSEKVSIAKEKFLLQPELEEIYSTFTVKQYPNLKLYLENPHKKENLYIFSDQVRFKRIMNNLIKNAFKYTDKGSVTFGYQILASNEIQFYVRDTGSGIGIKNIKGVYDPFVTASANDKNARGGNDLGLFISKELTDRLGGKFLVESIHGKGSTFYVRFPYVCQSHSLIDNPQIQKEKSPDWGSKKILVAEDEMTNFLLLEYMLKDTGVKLIHAKNGKEAVDIFQKNNHMDAIIMDIKMPVMDGMEATRQIRFLDSHVPIVALTSFVMANKKRKCIEAGCNHFLSKPVKRKDVIITLEKHFDRN